jgi:hypothetical protein
MKNKEETKKREMKGKQQTPLNQGTKRVRERRRSTNSKIHIWHSKNRKSNGKWGATN